MMMMMMVLARLFLSVLVVFPLSVLLVEERRACADAFVVPPLVGKNSGRLQRSSSPSLLHYNNDDMAQNNNDFVLERVVISGVSVSADPPGFFILLQASKGTLPLRVTSAVEDMHATTSPESLTCIQLLSGVDMAGAILPPETLAKLLVLGCESLPFLALTEEQRRLVQQVHASLQQAQEKYNTPATTSLSYADAQPWLQSRIILPQVTLDEVVLEYGQKKWQCTLKCNVKGIGHIPLLATPELIQAVSYNYDPLTSEMFTCLALALRYKAPIVVKTWDQKMPDLYNKQDLTTKFPQRTTVGKLQERSTRVTQNIERGFEIHKLTKALEIARKLGDTKAEAKIRQALDDYDSFQELPLKSTTPNPTSSIEKQEQESGINLNDDNDHIAFQ